MKNLVFLSLLMIVACTEDHRPEHRGLKPEIEAIVTEEVSSLHESNYETCLNEATTPAEEESCAETHDQD